MDYETELKALKDAQNRVAKEQLDLQKTNQLGQIATQEAELKPKYQQERNKATAGSQLQAKSFAEFLANRGGTFSGLAGEGELRRNNLLNTNIGAIDLAQRGAETQLQQARTGVESDYAQGLAKAQGANELGYLNSMFNVKQSQAEAAQREKEARIKASEKEVKPTFYKGISLSQFGLQNATGVKGTKLDENTVRYQLDDKTFTDLPTGTNPYTGSQNKDVLTEGKVDSTKVFSNGYQPNNISGTPVKKAGITTVVNGQEQNVWAKGTGNKATLWYWDVTQGKYLPYTG